MDTVDNSDILLNYSGNVPSPLEKQERLVTTTEDRIARAEKAILEATDAALRSASRDVSLAGLNLNEDDIMSSSSIGMSDPSLSKWIRPAETEKEFLEMGITIFEDDFGGVASQISLKLDEAELSIRDLLNKCTVNENLEKGENEKENLDKENQNTPENIDSTQDVMDVENIQLERNNFISKAKYKEAQKLVCKIEFLKKCSDVRYTLDKIESMLVRNNLTKAVSSLSDIEQILKEIKVHVVTDEKYPDESYQDKEVRQHIFNSLESQILRLRSDLNAQALSILNSCLTFEPSSVSVTTKRPFSLEISYDMLSNLTKSNTNALDDVMYDLSTSLYDNIFQGIIQTAQNTRKKWNIEETIHPDNMECGDDIKVVDYLSSLREKGVPVASLEWKLVESSESDTSLESLHLLWIQTLDTIQTVMDFLYTHVFFRKPELCSSIGKHLFIGQSNHQDEDNDNDWNGSIMKHLLQMSWDFCIPSTYTDETKKLCASLLERAHKFEENLVEKGFVIFNSKISDENSHGECDGVQNPMMPLSLFVSDIEKKFAEKMRSTILRRGRNILLRDDFLSTVTVGVDSASNQSDVLSSDNSDIQNVMDKDGQAIFLFDKCSVSQVATKILKLCRETLDESISSNCLASTAPHLYRASRELLDLYRAIIPTVHGISSTCENPRIVGVFHNDCMYFANNMLTLGQEYREQFPPDADEILRKMCTFVDLVPIFRELGDKSLIELIEFQKVQLAHSLHAKLKNLKESLRMNEEVAEWSEAESAVRDTHYHLRHLSGAWGNILSQDVYGRSMGNMIDTFFSILLEKVMKAMDISEAASHFIAALFRDAMQCAELFIGGGEEGQGSVRGRKYCQFWNKFDAVRKFMSMSLVNISDALSDGVFISVTGPELSNLIEATFDDSEKRQRLLFALLNDEK